MIAISPQRNVAVDYDGTLVEPTAHKRFQEYLESVGVVCDEAVLQATGDYLVATSLPRDQVNRHYVDYLRSDTYQAPKVMPGAIRATRELCRSSNLHIVTSRATEVKSTTTQELQKNFPGMFTTFHFGAGPTKKAKIVESLLAILHIDDALEHAVRVADVASVILMPSPGQNNGNIDPRLIMPEAHKLVADGMNNKDWQHVWLSTWREIPYLVRDLCARQNQTQVSVF